MDSAPQQRSNKSSVLSLLNPVEEPITSHKTSKRNLDVPSIEQQQLDATHSNEKKKKVRFLGEIPAVDVSENTKQPLFTGLVDQHNFTTDLNHIQTQPYTHYHHDFFKGITIPTQHNNNNKLSPTVFINPYSTDYQQPSSIFDYLTQNQHYLPSLSSCNQLQPAVYPPPITPSHATTSILNPCSLPSILNPQTPSYLEPFPSFPKQTTSPSYTYFAPKEQDSIPVKKNNTTSPTYHTNLSHKHRSVLIQPSSQDPPIEARLIVDDPKSNPFTQQWMEHFQELKAFKEQHGHTNVTRSITGHYNLGNWVAEQRRKFKQGKITESQFNCLNQIGFEWDRSYYFFRTRHKKKLSADGSAIDSESPRTD